MLLTPYPEYLLCARSMNDYHLILNLKLARAIYSGILYPKGFSHSPPVNLWKDTPKQLMLYALILANEVKGRRFDEKTLAHAEREYNFFKGEYIFQGKCSDIAPPFWLGDASWHRYHRGLMHNNDQAFYSSVFIKTGVGINFETEYRDKPDLIFSNDLTQYEKQRAVAFIVNQKSAEKILNGASDG